jgi:RimJ/RimL family protein N-acetyltransferase
VRLAPWDQGDLALLVKLNGDPEVMRHLGGPETPAKLAERQGRYEEADSKQFKIVDDATGEGVGWVGYWAREWRDEAVFEVGWSVLPAFQGRGLASRATAALLAIASADGGRRFVHAFPSVENAGSNAICRKLGFTLLGACDFEYPPGSPMRCNDWRFDLAATPDAFLSHSAGTGGLPPRRALDSGGRRSDA